MTKRVVTGVLVGAAWLIALCYMPGWMLFGVLLLMSCACQNEFYQMMKRNGHPVSRNGGMAMGAVWLIACYAFPPCAAYELPMGHQFETLVLAALIFALLLRVLFDSRIARPVEHTGVTLLGFFYLPFMLSFFIRLAQWGADSMFEIPSARVGVYLASYLAAVVKFSDVGAFAVGITWGRHKMFPRISPKKSWEGFFGGIAAAMLVSVAMIQAAKHYTWLPGGPLTALNVPHALILGAVLGVVGAMGDLIESMFKRSANTKDSAGLLPGGGGGILDMFDSLTFTPAVLYFYLAWLVGQSISP
ncbi:MAG: phosphatidate cytidylyltransferase [Kiritimatiellae bacterium]|nr:phosphatidate cytidylyltransferase [Kiritimatiellia bacterium]MDD3583130.1 phosphatidate cytidylyltransferase [Kiritimatiellia bacterium]